jgi:hypothetical protein
VNECFVIRRSGGMAWVFATAAAGFTTALIACRYVSLLGVIGQATVLACSLASGG